MKNQDVTAAEQTHSQLKGVTPPQLSGEEIGELIEWLKEDAKNIPEFMIEEYEKRVREISRPPDDIRRG